MKGKVEIVWAKYDHRLDIDDLENICVIQNCKMSVLKKIRKKWVLQNDITNKQTSTDKELKRWFIKMLWVKFK